MNGISKLYDAVQAAVARVLNYLTVKISPNEMCELDVFEYILEQLQTLEMCEQAVKEDVYLFPFVRNALKTTEMCEFAFKEDVQLFEFVPKRFKTSEMCEEAVNRRYFDCLSLCLMRSRRERCVSKLLKKILCV